MNDERRVLAAALLVILLLGCASSGGSTLVKVPLGDSPQRGAADAWVTVVEFGDFECPYCRMEEPVLQDLAAIYGSDLRLVWKHLPLTGIHPHAQAAAIAAECANAQGRFWEMHDLLLVTALDDATLLADAGQVPGLDVAAWQACLGTAAPADRVAADVALGTRLGVGGTPTFYVDGIPVIGAVPESEFRAVVDQARSTAASSGIPRANYSDKAVLGL